MLMGVYGTLKQGNQNHQIHLDQKSIFSGYVDFHAKMYSNGRYPMLVKTLTLQQIYFEIYEISDDQLVSIDGLELPFGYHRELCEFDQVGQAWVYFYSSSIIPNDFILVESGCFEKEREW